MGLTSFFTAGEPEVRAWTIHKNTNAVKAAGRFTAILRKDSFRAEVVRVERFCWPPGVWERRGKRRRLRLEGKEYLVQEGDVILFRHSGEKRTSEVRKREGKSREKKKGSEELRKDPPSTIQQRRTWGTYDFFEFRVHILRIADGRNGETRKR